MNTCMYGDSWSVPLDALALIFSPPFSFIVISPLCFYLPLVKAIPLFTSVY